MSLQPTRWSKITRPTWLDYVMRGIGLLFILGLLGVFTGYYFMTNDARSLTKHLPSVDRIEIESVSLKDEDIDKVLATKILTGSETQNLENLWRDQNYDYTDHVMCHAPGYRIRFYKDTSLLTEATVCFHCHNIYFYKYPGAKDSESCLDATFDAESPQGKKLQTYLSDLFPGHDPEANKL